ncbi:hypothetical protein [Alkalibacillus aidingensis]|uniref:hypothetical protein n=1 Tax=Alkalibacillus aidingensis TaxID=2747607 RepID=UPI0016610E7E|nr:hypothetical protein [Alkalibacillus aidingensis]
MFPKALWMKEWKHSVLVCFGLLSVFLLTYLVPVTTRFDTWRHWQEHEPRMWEQMQVNEINRVFDPNFFGVISIGVILILAGVLIGLERNTKRHDFSMALPFSRTQMYLTKYLLGFLTLLISYNISFWLGWLTIAQSEFGYLLNEVDLFYVYLSPFLVYFLIYSFAMLVGTIAGEIKAQLVLTLIFLIFPQGIMVLIDQLLRAHNTGIHLMERLEWLFKDLFWFNYLNAFYYGELNLFIPATAAVIFIIAGVAIYQRTPSEYSGEFLMFRSLHPIFAFGIPICASLLGGFIVSSMAPYNAGVGMTVIFYWIGLLIALFFSWKITKKLLKR